MQEAASDISLDSVASTTASDVLIRSTGVHRTGPQNETARGRGFDAADTSQGFIHLLDIGMVAGSGQGCSPSGEYSGRREACDRKIKMGGSLDNGHHLGMEHRQRDTSTVSIKNEGTDRELEMRTSLDYTHHSGLENRHPDHPHGSIKKSSQMTMDVSDLEPVAGEGQDILHMSKISGHRDVLQRSLKKTSHRERVCYQDSNSSTFQISVKRLRQISAPLPDFTVKKRDPTHVPPALSANKYPAVRFAPMEGTSEAVSDSSVQKNVKSKSSKSPKALVTKHFQNGTDENVSKRKTQGICQKNKEVEISQFATGQKESLLAALNKRVQSGHVNKEVRVQLLEDATSSSKKSTGLADEKAYHSEVQSATIAAATAAAIAVTAPVLKAQSDLEVQVNSVSQLLNKLQEADRQLQKLTEQQIKIQSQPSERLYHGKERVSELERQLAQLTEQRLEHLEKLQHQQLEMQSHFIRSAIKSSTSYPEPVSVCTHVPTVVPKSQSLHQPLTAAPPRECDKAVAPPVKEDNGSGKSPLETPAPRRFAPQPISMDVQPAPKALLEKENVEEFKNPNNADKVHFLEKILGHDGIPLSKSSYGTHSSLKLSKVERRPFNDSFLQSDGVTKRTNVSSSTAVQKADDVLQDLNALKQEMQYLMKDAKQWKSQAEDFKPRISTIMTSAPVFAPLSFRRSAANPSKSMFEEAECILREVQNNRKVIDDNLDAIIRAKDGAAMYSLINALTTNSSNGAEKIRIQKNVDSWITEITSEIQDELARKDIRKKKPEDRVQETSHRRNAGSAKDIKKNRDQEIKGPARGALKSTKLSAGVSAKVQHKSGVEKLRGQQSRASLKKDEKSKVPQKVDHSSLTDEEALNRVYGTPIYEGHRSTLKKGPYLRFSSPSPKSKARRPKVLETVRGVKLKSAKIQTGPTDTERRVVKVKAPDFSVAKDYGPQYVFTPSAEPSLSGPMEGHLFPIAIPLGRSRFDSAPPLPSAVILSRPQPVVVNVSIPPRSAMSQPKVAKPNIAVVEVKSEKKEPPQLSVQVLPCVDIDSLASESTSQTTSNVELVPPSPSPVSPDIQNDEDEIPEPLVELNGWGKTNTPQHGRIPFPPPVPPPQTRTDILEEIITRKETLENRLVNWVEQEIMARVISEMHPIRRDTVPDVTISSANHSEATSDIVEAAVDSSLIRKYVNEALAEIIATMLREQETGAVSSPCLEEHDVQLDPDDNAPVPTPQIPPPASPLPSATEPSIMKTPEPSPQTSVEEPEIQQETLYYPVEENNLPVHDDTPKVTPVPSPPRQATPTPVLSEENEVPTVVQAPPNPWGDMELPLEEENPHSAIEAVEYKDAAVMTVAVDEEPRSLISAASSEKSAPLSPKQRTPSPVPSPSVSAPSTNESSLTVTVTESDTTDKPISEGEIVYSYGQIAAARALAEVGLVHPNLTESLSSTLRDANDMEFDPPSEGQVIQGPHRGAHHDPVLSLLAKFNQDLVAPQEAFYHLESSGEDSSSGEISEGQRPRLTTAAEQVLVGHSVSMGRPSNTDQTAGHLQNRPSSPGQCTNVAGANREDAENISTGPMSIRDLDSQFLSVHYPHADYSSQMPSVPRDTSQGPGQPQKEHQPTPSRFIQVGVMSAENLYQGETSWPTKNIPVTLPTMTEANGEVKATFVESDSSGADTF